MSAGPTSQFTPTNLNAIANCADLQARYRTESALTQSLKDRVEVASIRERAATQMLLDCQRDYQQNQSKLLGLAGQINAIPGCAIPN
ncbi:MAG: hypothetical protein WCH39_00375 [Schlesneria sp.]